MKAIEIDYSGVDWDTPRPYLFRGALVHLTFEQLLARTLPFFKHIIFGRFRRLMCYYDDLWQLCSLTCASIYAKGKTVSAAFFYSSFLRCFLTFINKKCNFFELNTLSLDAPVGNTDGRALAALVPVHDRNIDEINGRVIDFSIFTDKERLFIAAVLQGYEYIRGRLFMTVRAKLRRFLNGEPINVTLTQRERNAMYHAAWLAKPGVMEKLLERQRQRYSSLLPSAEKKALRHESYKKSFAANPELYRERGRQNYFRRRDKAAAYYIAHRDEILLKNTERRARLNAERVAALAN